MQHQKTITTIDPKIKTKTNLCDACFIEVRVDHEAGYSQAIKGLSYSYQVHDHELSSRVAERLCGKDGGHNKFLESIMLWLDVRAPRYWWQEADTYRVGSTKQSKSTMHTIIKQIKSDPAKIDELFEYDSLGIDQRNRIISAAQANDLLLVKRLLPEGFIQRREWVINYKTLRNIILQRRNHRLPHWQLFIADVLKQVEHPELLPSLRQESSLCQKFLSEKSEEQSGENTEENSSEKSGN